MEKGVCANRLENGDVNNVRVDYGNGMIMDIDVDDYIQKRVFPDCNQLPDCIASPVEEDKQGGYSYLSHCIDGVYLKVSFDVAGYGINDVLFSGGNVRNADKALNAIPNSLVSKEVVRRLAVSDVYSLPIQKMSKVEGYNELDRLLKLYGV